MGYVESGLNRFLEEKRRRTRPSLKTLYTKQGKKVFYKSTPRKKKQRTYMQDVIGF